MRRLNLAILVTLLALGGCTAADRYAAPLVVAHQGLLFDRHPDLPTASGLSWRGDWPACYSLHVKPETLHYRETIYDIQGNGPYSRDRTHRRFELHREGSGTR